jgi:hypothetical protein
VSTSVPVLRVAFLSGTRQPAVVITDLIAWMQTNVAESRGTEAAAVHQRYIDTLTDVLADATSKDLP